MGEFEIANASVRVGGTATICYINSPPQRRRIGYSGGNETRKPTEET
jgi:hypothetical protein